MNKQPYSDSLHRFSKREQENLAQNILQRQMNCEHLYKVVLPPATPASEACREILVCIKCGHERY